MMIRPRLAQLATLAAGMISSCACLATDLPARGWASRAGLVDLAPSTEAQSDDVAVLDRLLIQEAFARWGIAYDEGRADLVGDLFTKNAVVRVLNGSSTPVATMKGRDDIIAQTSSAAAQQADQRRHVISNVVVSKLDGAHAVTFAYGIVAIADEQNSVGTTVLYRAEMTKDQGIWRFSDFTIAMDHYLGTPPKTDGGHR